MADEKQPEGTAAAGDDGTTAPPEPTKPTTKPTAKPEPEAKPAATPKPRAAKPEPESKAWLPRPRPETAVAWKRLGRAFRWRVSRAQIAGGVLLAILGFVATVQVQALRSDDQYTSASRTQLVQFLDTLTQHSRRLESEINELERDRTSLLSGADSTQAAQRQAEQRRDTLSILAGTVPAHGQGIRVTISATRQPVDSTLMVNTVEELRDAGAESIELNDRVRLIAGSYILDAKNGLVVDGTLLPPPYVIDAIGDKEGLKKAMEIPGGISSEVDQLGGKTSIEMRDNIQIDSLHHTTPPKYAKPNPGSK